MDVRFAMPVYRSGKIFCWLSNTGHWPDIGGSVPGGFSASATAVEQEGLRLPPVKLFKKGVLDPEIHAIIASNIRIADQRIGDIKAQAAALMVGQDRLDAILDRYGDDTVVAAIAELRRRAALQMRAHIGEIADGVVPLEGVRRFRRRGRRAADHRARGREGGRHADLRFRRLEPALRRADEQRARHDAVVGLSGDAPHFSGRSDQRRRLRAADRQAAGRHLPRRQISAAGFGLRGGSVAAHRRGGVRGDGAGAARQGHGGAGRLQRQFRARRPRSGRAAATTSCTRSPAAAMAAMPATTG